MYIIFYSDNVAFLFDIKAVSRLSALKRANLVKFTGDSQSRKQPTNIYAFPKQLSETRSCQINLLPYPRSNTSELPASKQIPCQQTCNQV